MKKILICFLIATALLGGCNIPKQLPREVVIVPDVSASIDPDAERQMFTAIEDVAKKLHRGDTLTIIPITDDAEAELQGRTLHYAVPPVEDRQAYDADLRNLNEKIREDLANLQADVIGHPSKHSDILGSIRFAMREFSSGATDKRLVILSDFIQDDQQFTFRNDPRLRNVTEARHLGYSLMKDFRSRPDITVLLGRLQSKEFSSLVRNRQHAINVFWEFLFSPSCIHPDGPADLSRTLS